MTDRERLIELIDVYDRTYDCDVCIDVKKGRSCGNECLADYLLANGVILPPCNVGDTVYAVLADGFDLFVSIEKVTEVCSKGFYISDFFPPKDDRGSYILYEKIGKTVFLTYEEADKAIEERSSNNATQQPYTE